MSKPTIGDWIEIIFEDGRTWTGCLTEIDEDAIYITNGIDEGQEGHKAAECANTEVKGLTLTESREFSVK